MSRADDGVDKGMTGDNSDDYSNKLSKLKFFRHRYFYYKIQKWKSPMNLDLELLHHQSVEGKEPILGSFFAVIDDRNGKLSLV